MDSYLSWRRRKEEREEGGVPFIAYRLEVMGDGIPSGTYME